MKNVKSDVLEPRKNIKFCFKLEKKECSDLRIVLHGDDRMSKAGA